MFYLPKSLSKHKETTKEILLWASYHQWPDSHRTHHFNLPQETGWDGFLLLFRALMSFLSVPAHRWLQVTFSVPLHHTSAQAQDNFLCLSPFPPGKPWLCEAKTSSSEKPGKQCGKLEALQAWHLLSALVVWVTAQSSIIWCEEAKTAVIEWEHAGLILMHLQQPGWEAAASLNTMHCVYCSGLTRDQHCTALKYSFGKSNRLFQSLHNFWKEKTPFYAKENIKQKSLLNPLELDREYNTAGPHSCTGCFLPSTPGSPGLPQHTDPNSQHRSLQNPSQITSCHWSSCLQITNTSNLVTMHLRWFSPTKIRVVCKSNMVLIYVSDGELPSFLFFLKEHSKIFKPSFLLWINSLSIQLKTATLFWFEFSILQKLLFRLPRFQHFLCLTYALGLSF